MRISQGFAGWDPLKVVGVRGQGFRVWSSGFRVWDSGLRVSGLGNTRY